MLLTLAALSACDADAGTQTRPDISSERVVMEGRNPIPAGARPRGRGAFHAALAARPEPSPALLARGKTVFAAFCAPCHGGKGRGDGPVVAHGFPAPPAFGEPAMRDRNAAHTVAVVTNGVGAMWPLAERIPPADRWAVAQYVEQLKREGSP